MSDPSGAPISACSSVAATVLLPLPLRPVNHRMQPRWPSFRSFSCLRYCMLEVSSTWWCTHALAVH